MVGTRFAPRGAGRLGRGMGLAAALALALLAARRLVPDEADRLVAHTWSEALRQDLTWGLENPKLGNARYFTFLLTLGWATGCVALYAIADRAVSWKRRLPPLVWFLRAVTIACAIQYSFRESPFVGKSSLVLIVATGAAFAGQARGGRCKRVPSTGAGAAALVVCTAGGALAWAAWLTMGKSFSAPALGLAFFAFAVAGWRLGLAHSSVNREAALSLDAWTAAPLLILPLLGLMRDPSPWWVVAAMSLGVGLRTMIETTAYRTRISIRFGAIVTPWVFAAIVFIPLRFRDLDNVNWKNHEGQHLTWINSIFFGKLMMADAGFIYGPLREYLLAVFSGVAGISLESVRIGHVVANLGGLALLLAAGWYVARGRPWLQAWAAYFTITRSPAVFMLDYWRNTSFGWADAARVGSSTAAVVGLVRALEGIPIGKHLARREVRTLVGWGAVTGIVILYSPDFGLCALGACCVAIGGDRLLRHGPSAPQRRLVDAVSVGAGYVSGVAASVGTFVAIYALYGRAGRLAHAFVNAVLRQATGAYGGLSSPFSAGTFLTKEALTAPSTEQVLPLSLIVPFAACVIASAILTANIVQARWTARSTLLLALLSLSAATLRHPLLRADPQHLLGNSTPSLFLIVAIAAETADYAISVRVLDRWRALPLGAVVVALTALAGLYVSESNRWAIGERAKLVMAGTEAPSAGPPYLTPGIPRAGDVLVPQGRADLVRFIREQTRPRDPIFVRASFLGNEDIYFLSDRRNPTRFDVMHEILTVDLQREAFASIVRDPPALVIGGDYVLLGDETNAYIRDHWKTVATIDGLPVLRFVPPS